LAEPQTITEFLEEFTEDLPRFGVYADLELEIQALRGLGAFRKHKKNGGSE